MDRPWNWPPTDPGEEAARLTQELGMPRPVAVTVARRGHHRGDDLDRFLNPRLGNLADPRAMDGMERAVERVWRAVDGGERIFVHGDYDVDGITGTAFLARTLRAMGATVVPYVPSRADGYGLGPTGIEAAVDAGASLLVTVDNGIRSVDEVETARAAGLDVVILDHHAPGDRLPEAVAVVDPLRGEGGSGFETLAGVGVAAKFVHALAAARPGTLPGEVYKDALQLVALGTVADSMELLGENRILVSHGLARLSASKWPGVQALKAVARLDRGDVSAADIAFFIAPRINAAGRMGDPGQALDLLLTEDPEEAYRLADRMEKLNAQRREVEQGVIDEAATELRARGTLPAAAVLWSDRWPVGVIGIVASRVLDRFHRPAFLIAMDGEYGRGSARSVTAFPLPEALAACAGELEEYGGHAEAAGFRIRRDRLEAFRDRMESLAATADLEGTPRPLDVDAAVELGEMNAGCVEWLNRLAPFGRGNPEPLFGAEGLTLAGDPSVVGKRHLRMSFAAGGRRWRAIAFNQGERGRNLGRGGRLDAVFHATFDTWRGGREVQLVVRDFRIR